MLNVILGHLERRGSYAKILFVDFSSAFNTIQPHLMIRKLIDLGVGKRFVMLVHSFLTNRTQYVNVSGVFITCAYLHRSSPGMCTVAIFHYFKHADDTALVGLLSDDEIGYKGDIDHFVSRCVANCLKLNVIKTKELIIDFRSGALSTSMGNT